MLTLDLGQPLYGPENTEKPGAKLGLFDHKLIGANHMPD
jgi:hypothetical protein